MHSKVFLVLALQLRQQPTLHFITSGVTRCQWKQNLSMGTNRIRMEKSIQEIMVCHATRNAAVGVWQGGVVFDEHDPLAGRQPRCDSLGIAQHLVVDHRLSHWPGNKAGLGIQREDAAQRIDQKYLPDAGVLLNRGIDRLVGGCGRPPWAQPCVAGLILARQCSRLGLAAGLKGLLRLRCCEFFASIDGSP